MRLFPLPFLVPQGLIISALDVSGVFDKSRSALLVINHEAVSRINIKLGDDDGDAM